MEETRTRPEDVLAMTSPCADFLVPLEANAFNFKFGNFLVRDMDSGAIIFDVEREYQLDTEETRFIHYSFAPEFL
jgi:hypothetical protein